MKLSVIIVNYNVQYFLEQCLLTVTRALREIDSEIIVVDNHSVDASCKMVREHFPDVVLIENDENVGFSKANNQAIEQVQGEYVLLLNPDTVVREDTFTKCIEFMDSHPKAGALGVKMIDGKGNYLPESKRGLPTPEVALYKMLGLNKLFPRSRRFGKYHMGYLGDDEINEVEVLAGAYIFMRRSVLDEIGLLDETYFMYGEDIDLSYRITKAGYKNYYFPETSIIHYKGESTKKMTVNYVFIFYRAMVIFARKHYSGQSARLLVFLINAAIYVRAAFAVLQRFFAASWLFFADTLTIAGGMYLLKNYWEEHIKFIDSYPLELMTIHVPYYIFLWVISVYLSGGYKSPYSTQRVLRGIVFGTVLIAAIYGLLPNHLRFSRALIILGAIWASISMLGWRILSHYRKYGNVSLGTRSEVTTVVVGNVQERARVAKMLKEYGSHVNLLGFVSPDDDESDEVLGQLDRLDEICQIYSVEEVIFCAKDVPSSRIIQWMTKLQKKGLNFKILPEERYFVIGSNSKNTTGEFYTEEIAFRLSDSYNIRKKRFFDLLSSLILLALGPVLGLFAGGYGKYFKNCIAVLFNRRSWVSYDPAVSTENLPPLKRGVFYISSHVAKDHLNDHMREKLNFLYARNYSIDSDLSVLVRSLFRH